MRIAMIGSRGIGAHEGGVERLVETLSAGLSAFGHDVLVYSRERCRSFEPAIVGGQPVFTPGFGGKHLETLTHTLTACMDVLRRHVDVVHVHSPGPALCMPIVKAAGLPVVLTIHAADWKRAKWSLPARAVLRTGLEIGMRLADRVTAVAPHLARELSATFNRKVAYVPNAVEPWAVPDADDLRRWGLEQEGYGLYVGRIVPEKRLHVLLDAWRRACPHMPLVIAGGTGDRAYAKRCRQVAPASTLWLGSVRPEALESLYGYARFLVHPSVLEGASLVLMEAAVQGRCIVVTDIEANRDVLGEAAVWVPPDDPAALAEALLRCNDDPALRREVGARARQRVTRRFTIQQLVSKMEAMYESATSGERCE